MSTKELNCKNRKTWEAVLWIHNNLGLAGSRHILRLRSCASSLYRYHLLLLYLIYFLKKIGNFTICIQQFQEIGCCYAVIRQLTGNRQQNCTGLKGISVLLFFLNDHLKYISLIRWLARECIKGADRIKKTNPINN